MAQLRRDLGKIILRKVVDAAVRTGPLELPFDKYAGSWPGDEFKKHNIDYASSENQNPGCIWTFCQRSIQAAWNCRRMIGW